MCFEHRSPRSIVLYSVVWEGDILVSLPHPPSKLVIISIYRFLSIYVFLRYVRAVGGFLKSETYSILSPEIFFHSGLTLHILNDV